MSRQSHGCLPPYADQPLPKSDCWRQRLGCLLGATCEKVVAHCNHAWIARMTLAFAVLQSLGLLPSRLLALLASKLTILLRILLALLATLALFCGNSNAFVTSRYASHLLHDDTVWMANKVCFRLTINLETWIREKLLETTIIKEARSVVRRLHAIRLALRSSDLICKLRIDLGRFCALDRSDTTTRLACHLLLDLFFSPLLISERLR
mmetsp:Transcript_37948/g.86084  ORF Transcript_37948/g.86084 Transcript_37948/m.86084 type:complete len:208 (-) Transcript_37948:1279-1902(-)